MRLEELDESKFKKWTVAVALVVGFLLATTLIEVRRESLAGTGYIILPNHTRIFLDKNQIYIFEDQAIYTLKDIPECSPFVDHFRKYPQNIPQILINRCVLEYEGVK